MKFSHTSKKILSGAVLLPIGLVVLGYQACGKFQTTGALAQATSASSIASPPNDPSTPSDPTTPVTPVNPVPPVSPVAPPSAPISPISSPTPLPSGASAAQVFVQGLKFGVNIERSNAWTMGDFYKGEVAFTYLKSVGFTHVRLFYPWEPSVNFGGSNGAGIAPTQAQFARMIPVIKNANAAGLKVFIDLCDLMGTNDFKNYQSMIDSYLNMASKSLADAGLDPSMVAVGAVNEWVGGSNNATFNAQRQHVLSILRANLPGFTLTTGSNYWKYYQNLMASDFELSTDTNIIYETHAYDSNASSAAHWQTVGADLQAWQASHGNVPVMFGEAGFGDASNSSGAKPADWAASVNAMSSTAIANFHPTFWALTNGNGYRMNPNPADYHIEPTLEAAIKKPTDYNETRVQRPRASK